MKLKKKLTTLLLSGVLTVSAVTTAFAGGGFADTRGTAAILAPNTTVTQRITSGTDQDWYMWVNNTGTTVSYTASLTPPAGDNYDITVTHIMTQYNNYEYDIVGGDQGTGQTDAIGGSTVFPGDVIYIKINGHTAYDHDIFNDYTVRLDIY
jgi:hypothetical protein